MTSHLPKLIIPQSSYEQFEKTAYANPRFYRMSLIEGQLEIIMGVHTETGTTSKLIEQLNVTFYAKSYIKII